MQELISLELMRSIPPELWIATSTIFTLTAFVGRPEAVANFFRPEHVCGLGAFAEMVSRWFLVVAIVLGVLWFAAIIFLVVRADREHHRPTNNP